MSIRLNGKIIAGTSSTNKSSGTGGFNLFDTKIMDHILTFEETAGWALQGTYVYKQEVPNSRYGYPDFYNTCVTQYQQSTPFESVLSGSAITMYLHSNGHVFYDIADEGIVDHFFNQVGAAWFYGVDIENERIKLPRNNFFIQLTTTQQEVGNFTEAGLPNITGSFAENTAAYAGSMYGTGAFKATSLGTSGAVPNAINNSQGKIDFNASRSSSIYGNSSTVQPKSVRQLLYICVGNTKVTQAETTITDISTSDNDVFPLLYHIPSDELLQHAAWLLSDGEWKSGVIYSTAFNYLVNEYNLGTEHTDILTDVNGVTYTIPYKTIRGKKVVDVAYESIVTDIYNAIGSAWYYIIDQQNSRFKLPMSNNMESYTMDPTKAGLDVRAGLPNITGSAGSATNLVSGAFYLNTGVAGGNFNGSTTGSAYLDASRSSSVYGKSDTVTPAHTKFYLYFKVGNAVTNLDVIDAGKVLSETVHKSTLEQVQCVVETYSNGTSWYRVWSDGWCEQGGRAQLNEISTTTITLLKSYSSMNYSVNAVSITASTASDTECGLQCTPITVSQITLTAHYLNPNNQTACWEAKGYIV